MEPKICHLIIDFKHKQWICLAQLPDLDCHLCGGSDEDVGAEVIPGDGPQWGEVGGETLQGGGAVMQRAVVQDTAFGANKVGVLKGLKYFRFPRSSVL